MSGVVRYLSDLRGSAEDALRRPVERAFREMTFALAAVVEDRGRDLSAIHALAARGDVSDAVEVGIEASRKRKHEAISVQRFLVRAAGQKHAPSEFQRVLYRAALDAELKVAISKTEGGAVRAALAGLQAVVQLAKENRRHYAEHGLHLLDAYYVAIRRAMLESYHVLRDAVPLLLADNDLARQRMLAFFAARSVDAESSSRRLYEVAVLLPLRTREVDSHAQWQRLRIRILNTAKQFDEASLDALALEHFVPDYALHLPGNHLPYELHRSAAIVWECAFLRSSDPAALERACYHRRAIIDMIPFNCGASTEASVTKSLRQMELPALIALFEGHPARAALESATLGVLAAVLNRCEAFVREEETMRQLPATYIRFVGSAIQQLTGERQAGEHPLSGHELSSVFKRFQRLCDLLRKK